MGRTVISGIGLLTPLGAGVERTWQALLAGEFIRDHSVCRVPHPPAQSRVAAMALIAAREAIADAGWASILRDRDTALAVGTSKGPVENWLGEDSQITAGQSPAFGLARLTTELAESLGFGPGPRACLSAACASGLHALIHADLLLKSGIATRAIVVAAEASVHPLFVGSFRRLGVIAPEGAGCRPLDRNRSGFLISDAAAALCLEMSESTHGYASVDRTALAGDAAHLTGADPAGRALRHVLSHVADGRPVDLVHAHATGTELNDPIELDAIESTIVPARPKPAVFSHKGALGHSLGASGLVSIVLNCISHRSGRVPGNIRTTDPLPTRHVQIPTQLLDRPIRRSIALASGFGGATAAVSIVS